ncbi:hypothetical protein KCU93_g5520, partial [Aureobasidium melanogenum]
MAEPPPPPPPPPTTMTITVDIPMLANIFQSTHDLRTEVHNLQMEIRDLRTDFSTRLEAVEAQLARQPTIQSASNAIFNLSQNIVEDTTLAHEDPAHQEEDWINDENLYVQMDDRLDHDDLPQQGDIIQEDEDIVTQEDIITCTHNIVRNHEEIVTHTQQDDVTHEDDFTHNHEDGVTQGDRESLAHEVGQSTVTSSSPSVDGGITVVTQPVVPAPAAGIKRKRTVRHTPAYINRSGFMIRSSDDQLAEKRNGEAEGPSGFESPFDDNDDRDDSSDGFVPADQELRKLGLIDSLPPNQETSQEAGLAEP